MIQRGRWYKESKYMEIQMAWIDEKMFVLIWLRHTSYLLRMSCNRPLVNYTYMEILHIHYQIFFWHFSGSNCKTFLSFCDKFFSLVGITNVFTILQSWLNKPGQYHCQLPQSMGRCHKLTMACHNYVILKWSTLIGCCKSHD